MISGINARHYAVQAFTHCVEKVEYMKATAQVSGWNYLGSGEHEHDICTRDKAMDLAIALGADEDDMFQILNSDRIKLKALSEALADCSRDMNK